MDSHFFKKLMPQVRGLAKRLTEENLIMGTAESCTGGLLAGLLTELPGSSVWFKGGVVSYANELKTSLLKVDPAIIEEYGAVSEECAKAMALGCIQELDLDLAISITGIAGPTGACNGKPVGTVWIATAFKRDGRKVHSKDYYFSGERTSVRLQAVEEAVSTLCRML